MGRGKIPTMDLREADMRGLAGPDRPRIPQGSGGAPRATGYRPAISHRQAVIVMGVLGIFVFRWWVSGKLGKAVSAWAGAGSPNVPKDPQGSTAPAGSGATSQQVAPGSGPWGLKNVAYSRMAPASYWQGANAPDRGLVPNETGEWNYGLPSGSHEPVYLPNGGKGWSETSQGMQPGLGGYEVWKDPAGGVLAFLHLASLYDPTEGTAGIIGTTGWPTDPRYGAGQAGPSNAHLAVIFGPESRRYING